jgi:Galactose oxidase, central domain
MSPFSRFAILAILAAAAVSLVSAQENQVVTGFDVTTLAESKLPQALSDMTAVLDANTSKVYIHGGCNATDGNVYDSIAEVFTCGSISSSSYVFDISTRSFTELNPMPTARYRHAAVIINSQVWLVGGRNLTDSVVGDVDVRMRLLLLVCCRRLKTVSLSLCECMQYSCHFSSLEQCTIWLFFL